MTREIASVLAGVALSVVLVAAYYWPPQYKP